MRTRRFVVAALAAATVGVFVGRASAAPPPEDFTRGTAVIAAVAPQDVTRGTAVIALVAHDHYAPGLGGQLPPPFLTP
jgi:hypothetical protein